MHGQNGFLDVEDRLKELSAEGDPLEKLAATVDFEILRPVLREALGSGAGGKGGRPGFDPALHFGDSALNSRRSATRTRWWAWPAGFSLWWGFGRRRVVKCTVTEIACLT
jgi:hypothetical protein